MRRIERRSPYRSRQTRLVSLRLWHLEKSHEERIAQDLTYSSSNAVQKSRAKQVTRVNLQFIEVLQGYLGAAKAERVWLQPSMVSLKPLNAKQGK